MIGGGALVGLLLGAVLTWGVVLLGKAFDLVGLTAHGPRAALLRDHPWQTSLTVGSVIAVFMAGSMLLDVVKETGWGGLMPAWIWPVEQKTETTVLIRLARFVHWIGVALGVVIIGGSVIYAASQIDSVPRAEREHAAWEARHPVLSTGERAGVGDGYYDGDYEPSIPSPDYGTPLAIGVFGALVALFARGLRYIMAGE
ncbi:hypothetical protein [Sphingomonas rubra]|nr:hypothetical protein [Sphingomonas rubra]